MKKLLTVLLCLLLCGTKASADEGMWVPALISSRIKDMKAKGFRLTAEDIYSINRASLKDAVVLFNGGCTAELISDQGLLLTNHHCGYAQIQAHSSVEHDYLTHGFWAMNRSEELPNKEIGVEFLIRMEDVTEAVLEGTDETMPRDRRERIIARNIETIQREAVQDTHYKAAVEPFYYGNQYFLFISEEFTDVRLVCAPPSGIGKFGGDTDNWMWPRHTGDFSLFRIYADRNNRPAPYSADNVPYRPRKSLSISTRGLEEGDFTFIYGYPGSTRQYIVSDAVDYILNRSNPHKIRLRTIRLEIMNEEQAKDADTRIRYASKNATVANAWKKWQGESKGIARLGTIGKKQELEKRFTAWAADKPLYANVLPRLHRLYAELEPYAFAYDYYREAYRAIELTGFAARITKTDSAEAAQTAADFFKNYTPRIDLRTAEAMLAQYMREIPEEFHPEYLAESIREAGSVERFAQRLFTESDFSSPEKTARWLALDGPAQKETARRDPAVLLGEAFETLYREKIAGPYDSLNTEIRDAYRLYVKGLMEMDPERDFFPDANLTQRVAYGHIEGYRPSDGIYYTPQSTLEGIIEKDNPEIYDYDIPQRLRNLHASKDYGRWEVGGTVPVAFLATNHTTGGNSGSPVLNGEGHLVGLNFDRTWESTMSDIEFDPAKCRNIAVDIRYVLFLIDKVGGAGYLLEEMKFAE